MTRWRRLSVVAAAPPPIMLLEDLVDLSDMLERMGRAAPAHEWVDEIRESINDAGLEDLL